MSCNFHLENSFKFTDCPNTFYSKTAHFRRMYFFSVPSVKMSFIVLPWLLQYPKCFWRLQTGLTFLSEISSMSLSGFSWLDFEICIFVNKVVNKMMYNYYCIPSGGIHLSNIFLRQYLYFYFSAIIPTYSCLTIWIK